MASYVTSDAKTAAALCAAGFTCVVDPASVTNRVFLRFTDPKAERAAMKFYSRKLKVDALTFLTTLDAIHDRLRTTNRRLGEAVCNEG